VLSRSVGPLVVQTSQIVFVLRRESLIHDEEDPMYAGYRMWTADDYGLNPEHAPVVKIAGHAASTWPESMGSATQAKGVLRWQSLARAR
jgi:hypothetical protein